MISKHIPPLRILIAQLKVKSWTHIGILQRTPIKRLKPNPRMKKQQKLKNKTTKLQILKGLKIIKSKIRINQMAQFQGEL